MPKLLSQANFSNITVTSLTTTSDSQAVLDVFSKESYRSARWQIQVVRGSSYNSGLIKVIHDGTNTYMTEYGNINQPNVGIATFSTDVNSGDLRLLAYPDAATATTFKFIYSAIKS